VERAPPTDESVQLVRGHRGGPVADDQENPLMWWGWRHVPRRGPAQPGELQLPVVEVAADQDSSILPGPQQVLGVCSLLHAQVARGDRRVSLLAQQRRDAGRGVLVQVEVRHAAIRQR
jgi:hypothetical protein